MCNHNPLCVIIAPGVFLLLHAYAFLKYLQSFMTKSEFRQVFVLAIAGAAGLVFLGVVGLTYLGEDCVKSEHFAIKYQVLH